MKIDYDLKNLSFEDIYIILDHYKLKFGVTGLYRLLSMLKIYIEFYELNVPDYNYVYDED